MRRSDVGVYVINERIKEGKIEAPFKAVIWYTKGLFNSASHLINLLQYLFGKIDVSKIYNSGRLWQDHDPEPDFQLINKQGEFNFFALSVENFFHNTMEIIARNGRLRYEFGGQQITWDGTDLNNVFSGYTVLVNDAEYFPSDFSHVQWHVADQLVTAMQNKAARICTAESDLETTKILEKIKGLI